MDFTQGLGDWRATIYSAGSQFANAIFDIGPEDESGGDGDGVGNFDGGAGASMWPWENLDVAAIVNEMARGVERGREASTSGPPLSQLNPDTPLRMYL